ncbi:MULTISPECIES: glycosyltransferase family 2 protein [Aphanothece]|uniref:glycosyltransferase family 2 protein n=1 Tax=Aphanothece TaxID=1121 RepID=UPI0039847E99
MIPNSLVIGFGLVKNEEDIIEAFVRHNLHYCTALFLADNGSSDCTAEILTRLIEEGLPLAVVQDPVFPHAQSQKMTELMHRLALASDADFLIPLDADEFIQAESRSEFLAQLQQIPLGGCGLLPWRTYLPMDQRTTVLQKRFSCHRAAEHPQYYKVVVRSIRTTEVFRLYLDQGSHNLLCDLDPVSARPIDPLALAHLPVRSSLQIGKKGISAWMANLAQFQGDPRSSGAQWGHVYRQVLANGLLSEDETRILALRYAQDPPAENSEVFSCDNPLRVEPPESALATANHTISGPGEPDAPALKLLRAVCAAWERSLQPPHEFTPELHDHAGSPHTDSNPDKKIPGAFSPDWHSQKLFLDLPFLEWIVKRYRPRSVLDVGCGSGSCLSALRWLGVEETYGVDGIQHVHALIPSSMYQRSDLRQPLSLHRTYEGVLCLEVAEHLPPGSESTLIGTILRHAERFVVFSAAQPDQPGDGHINGKPQEYWIRQFHQAGWNCAVIDSLLLRSMSTFQWLRRNLLLFKPATAQDSMAPPELPLDHLIASSREGAPWGADSPGIISHVFSRPILKL